MSSEKLNNCHKWVLPKETIVHYKGIPYYLENDTEIAGNTDPTKITEPNPDALSDFFGD